MKKTRRLGQSQEAAGRRTSRKTEVAPHQEGWATRVSWRTARMRGAAMHAFAAARERARKRVDNVRWRTASAWARLTRGARGREQGSPSGLLRPALASLGAAGLAFLVSESAWGTLAAGGWVFAIALLLTLRSAQQRNALAVQHELEELRQQLRVTHRNGVAMRRELYELVQQLRATQPPVQDDEFEVAEEVDPSDEPTRAVPVPKPVRVGWRKRFGLHWPVSR